MYPAQSQVFGMLFVPDGSVRSGTATQSLAGSTPRRSACSSAGLLKRYVLPI